jgi:hypothetical protein
MLRLMRRLATCAVLLTSAIAVAAVTPPAAAAVRSGSGFPAAQATAPLKLDPSLSDPQWTAGALPVGGGFENLTTRSKAPHETQPYLLYDASAIYVGFRSEQTGVPIAANQTTNNVGFGLDDFVGVGIDTSGNGTQVYYFEATPRGVRYQQAAENARYQPDWQAAAAVDGTSWNVVLVIPLRALRIHAGTPQTWRFNFIRNVAATGEHYSFGYDGLMSDGPIPNGWPNFTDVRFWPSLTGIAIASGTGSVRPLPRAEIYALGSAGRDRTLFAQANGSFAEQGARPVGADLSYPITNTINLVGTLAPDFSNVEIDQQTIAPQEFRRSLQEYRPFFAQGASFINTNPMQFFTVSSPGNLVFYSPNIGPFDRGAKVEGTFGLQSFGALNFRGYDQATGNAFNDVAYGYKHALPDRTFMYWTDGVFARHSVAGDDATVEGGVAGRNLHSGLVYGVDQSFERGGYVPAPGFARSLNAFADVHKPNYEIFTQYADITPNYNPIDGFTISSDLRGPLASLNFSGANKLMKNYNLFFGADRFVDRSGSVHEADSIATFSATFKNGLSISNFGPSVGLLRGYDVASGPGCVPSAGGSRTYFTGFPCYVGGRNDRFNFFGGALGYRDGTPAPIDVSFNEGPFGSAFTHLYTSSTSRQLGKRYSLGLEYDGTYERDLTTGAVNSQWLRRVSLGTSFGADANASISLRGINGTGGFAVPGLNLAASYHRRMPNGNELFINYGTPAATATLDRLIVKYLLRIGGGAGT